MVSHRLATVLAAFVCVFAMASRARAQDVSAAPVTFEASPPPALTIVASSGLNGEFAPLVCDDAPSPALLHFASQLTGEPGALSFDAGGFLGTAALSQLAIDHDALAVANVVTALHLRAMVLNQEDLTMPRRVLVRAGLALASRGAPLVLGNLRCAPSAADLCGAVIDATDPPLLIDTAAGRVAIVSAITPSARDAIARDRAEGMYLADPAEALGVATQAARAAGARWVVAVYDPMFGREVEDSLAVARHIPPRASPDVLFVRGAEWALRSASVPSRAMALVPLHAGGAVLVDSRVPFEPRAPRTGNVPDVVPAFVSQTHQWLCAELHRPLAGGQLATPMDQSTFASLVLDVLRERTHTEIAVINRGAVDSHAPFPLRAAITPLDVTAALPFDNQLRVTRLTGNALQAFLQSTAAQRFYVRGAAIENGQLRVNGRPTDEGVLYTLVTIDFVAEGGDGGIAPGLVYFPVGTDTTRDALLAWLSRPHHEPLPVAPLDPARRTLWVFRAALDTTFSAVIVDNPNRNVFTDAQLARTPSTTGRLDLEMHADAYHPLYRFENMVRLLYGATMSAPAGAPVNFLETADLITGRSTGVWRGLLSTRREWYRPRPYVDNYIESEFSRPSTRSYHHFEIRPTAGLRFELTDRFSVNFGAGLSWEVFATPLDLTPPGSTAAPLFNISAVLRSGHVFAIGSRFADGEMSLDAALRDPFGMLSAQMRFRARVVIPLFDPIALTLTYDMYSRYARYFDDQGFLRGEWAVSADASIGVRITFARAIQAFAF